MTRSVERAGSRIHYWEAGPQAGPLVVLSHGASMDHRLFDAQVTALAEAGYRTLVWDMRGHGRSKPLGPASPTIADMAEDLVALLDETGRQEPVCLVGQSLGGYVSQEAVFAHPDRVAALVTIGSTCTTMPLKRWEEWALRSSPWWFKLWPYGNLRTVISRATAVTSEAQAYAYDATGHMTKREFVAVWGAVARAIHPEPGYTIGCPLLISHGDRDTTGNVAKSAPAWAARDAHARYEVIPNAGHNANHDNPEAFNQILLEFLGDHYPADAGRGR